MGLATTKQSMWTPRGLSAWQWPQAKTRPPSFSSWRKMQLDEFLKQGFPTRHNEQWKYTDLSFLNDCQFVRPMAILEGIDISAYRLEDSYCLVFVNGFYMASLSDLQGLASQACVVNQNSLSVEDSFLYTSEQTRIVSYNTPLVTLNAALSFDGIFINLPAYCELNKKIHILHINTELELPYMLHPRHIIILGENAKATIVEQHVGLSGANYLSNVVTQIRLKAAANLTYYKFQQESEQAYHLASVQVDQHMNSCWQGYYAGFGAQLNRDDLVMDLVDCGAKCALTGFYDIGGKQHFDMHTYTQHAVENTQSEQNYRGLLAQNSHGVFNGKIQVNSGANQTKAHMTNHNLLLNQGVSVDTKPELVIYADDVQCSHGATIGQVDEEALFYLRSRGITEQAARELLADAFLEEIVDMFPCEQLQGLARTKGKYNE